MQKTVLITGSSSGIGKEAALYFAENKWNVVATMRNPEKRQNELDSLQDNANIDIIHLNVLDPRSIADAIHYTCKKYLNIDVIVNNAGYAVVGPFEESSRERILKQFETNVFGLMEVTHQIIPIFRQQKYGVIINLSSKAGIIGFPYYSIYSSTKWAIEGFSESLRYELEPFNIKIKLIEPGVVKTDFYGRSMDIMHEKKLNIYASFIEPVKKNIEHSDTALHPRDVAKVIFKAANDSSKKFRYAVGNDTKILIMLRKYAPESVFNFWYR
ncbi:MAG: SDR family oxidoreductase [Candidatus Peribacteraceae bacterium]|nr:SDR family oxidoreductase [Candidatus Peribacteraceae bacterium]